MENRNKKKSLAISIIILIIVALGIYYFTRGGSSNNNMQPSSSNQASGLQVTILQQGSGPEAKNGDTIAVNYTGTLDNGTAFDSNVDPKFGHVSPFKFVLGSGMVIKGWDLGVAGMKVGEKRKLVIPAELAYGADAVGSIPANSTLTFVVELLAIK
jgi:FKBP-type peptidyl-prolyl cis-trans isomerase FkpA